MQDWVQKTVKKGKRHVQVSSAASICCESAGGVLFTLVCLCVCVWGRGEQEERKGSVKEGVERWKGRDGRGEGRGGLLVISPEGDNGRAAHCNGCHVVPSLCTISQSAARSASQEDA